MFDPITLGTYCVTYSSLDTDEKACMYKTEGSELIIRDMNDNYPSTRTFVYQLEGRILDKTAVFAFIRCSNRIPQTRLDTMHKKGKIAAVRWGEWHKGIPLGNFPHNVGIYISTGSAYVSAKVSSNKVTKTGSTYDKADKIQMVGVPSEGMGEYIATRIVEEIRRARTFRRMVRRGISLFKEVRAWIEANYTGARVMTYHSVQDAPSDKIDTHGRREAYLVDWKRLKIDISNNDVPGEYVPLLINIYKTTSCTKYLHTFKKITSLMVRCEDYPCTEMLRPIQYGRVMIKINHSVGTTLDLKRLFKYLVKNKFRASFFNEKKKYIQVVMSDDQDDLIGSLRREAGYENTFQIYPTGSLCHSGTGSQSMERNYYRLMLCILRLIIRDDISDLPLWEDL